MHTNRISPARKFLLWPLALVGLALLAGCEAVTLTNLTPASMPENPSQIYTFSLRVAPHTNTVPPSSIAPHIVIDGQNYDMKKSPLGEGLYDFEYQLPAGREEVAYYFLVSFNVEGNGTVTPRETYTQVEHVKIVHRYVLSLEVNRGPIGARISVLGRGFTPQDQINFNGSPARTVFESPNALSFYVPAVETGRNYRVTLEGAAGSSPVGTFRVDPAVLDVSPARLSLTQGASQPLTYPVDVPPPSPLGPYQAIHRFEDVRGLLHLRVTDRNEQLLWEGAARTELSPERQRQQQIDRAVDALVQKLPVAR